MTGIFVKLLGMSVTASIVIAAVLVLRLILKRAPKIFSYLLWFVVIFRLLCPVTVNLPAAPLRRVEIKSAESEAVQEVKPAGSPVEELKEVPVSFEGVYVAEVPNQVPEPAAFTGGADESGRDPAEIPENAEVPADIDIYEILAPVWVFGMSGMALWGIASWILLRRKLKSSKVTGSGAFVSGNIDNSFIMGLIRPRIYLPDGLSSEETAMILRHEQTHLKRGDHIAKLLMFIALCVHWFNPLVYVAFKLFEKDMEMSCDEAVTKDMSREERADYTQVLLKISSKPVAAFTACFGESGARKRIRNVLSFRKPAAWVIVISALAVAVAGCVLAVDGMEENSEDTLSEAPADSTEVSDESEEAESAASVAGEEADAEPLPDGHYDILVSPSIIYAVDDVNFINFNTIGYYAVTWQNFELMQIGEVRDLTDFENGVSFCIERKDADSFDEENVQMLGRSFDKQVTVSDEYIFCHCADDDLWYLFTDSYLPVYMTNGDYELTLRDNVIIYDYSEGDEIQGCAFPGSYDAFSTIKCHRTLAVEAGEADIWSFCGIDVQDGRIFAFYDYWMNPLKTIYRQPIPENIDTQAPEDGTYPAIVNSYRIFESEEGSFMAFTLYDYLDIPEDVLDSMNNGDNIIQIGYGYGYNEVNYYDDPEPVQVDAPFDRYGTVYDGIRHLGFSGFSIWHVKDTDIWRVFCDDSPLYSPTHTILLPMSTDIEIYDYMTWVRDGNLDTDVCPPVSSFASTYMADGFYGYNFAENTVTIENGEVTRVNLYYRP